MLVNEISESTWRRAQERAQEQAIQAHALASGIDPLGVQTIMLAVDSSQPNHEYHVTITIDSLGVSVMCDCKAGQHETCCKHLAAALDTADLWWAVEPVRPDNGRPLTAAQRALVNGLLEEALLARLSGDEPTATCYTLAASRLAGRPMSR